MSLHPQSPRRAWPWIGVGIGGLGLIGTARWLQPSASGIGTHQQLGLPACPFHVWTGLPCPGCGLTTSFAHMARLDLAAGFEAHAMGPLLFGLVLVMVPGAWVAAQRGWSFGEVLQGREVERLVYFVIGGLGASWIVRVAGLLLG